MNAQFLRYTRDVSHTKLVLSTPLLKQLHFGSPLQRVPSDSGNARIESTRSFIWGGPVQNTEITSMLK
jgi:hypothetical protein